MNLESKNSGLYTPENSGKIIMGQNVNTLTETRLWQIAVKVHKELGKYPHTMLQFSPNQLIQAMHEGRAILCLNQYQKLLAFGQVIQYEQSWVKQEVYALNSWLAFKKGPYAKQLALASQDLIAETFPGAKFIAKTASTNIKAQQALEQIGGSKFKRDYSDVLKTAAGEPAYMFFYYLTKPKEGPNAPIFGLRRPDHV